MTSSAFRLAPVCARAGLLGRVPARWVRLGQVSEPLQPSARTAHRNGRPRATRLSDLAKTVSLERSSLCRRRRDSGATATFIGRGSE